LRPSQRFPGKYEKNIFKNYFRAALKQVEHGKTQLSSVFIKTKKLFSLNNNLLN